MTDNTAPLLQFLRRQEISQIAFGMYDLTFNWGDGGIVCKGQVLYEPADGPVAVWTEGHPFDGVPVLRLLKESVEDLDASDEGLWLRFSNGDQLTITRHGGPEAYRVWQQGMPIIVG